MGSLVEDLQWVLLIWFLLIPAPFPWYALPIMALLPLRPRLSAVSGASLMLSGVSAAYYLSFFLSVSRLSFFLVGGDSRYRTRSSLDLSGHFFCLSASL